MTRKFSLIALVLLLSGLALPASAQGVWPLNAAGRPAVPDLLPLSSRPDPVHLAAAQTAGSTASDDGPSFTLLSQFDGETEAAAVRDDLAYVATGPRLYIVDIADPGHTSVLGMSEPLTDMVVDVAVQGNYAYLANWTSGVQVIDVADPAHPRKVAAWKAAQAGAAFAVAASEDYLFVANGAAGFRVVNIADPLHPTEVGALATSGQPHGVALAGNLAYVADYDAGLKILDVADPAHPTLAGALDTPGNALKVAVAGARAYVSDQTGGVRIVDVSNRAAPKEIGVASNGSDKSILDATVVDHYLFGAQSRSGKQGDNHLVTWDIADPTKPVSFENPNVIYTASPPPLRVTQSAGKLYLSWGQLGLTIYEPMLGTSTDPLRSLGGRGWLYGYTLDVTGGRLYASSGNQDLYIYGVEQPAAPAKLRGGSINLGHNGVPWFGLSFMKLAAAGSYTYVGALIDRLITLNVSDPANVKQTAWYDSGSSSAQGITYDIALQGAFAYIAYDIGGLLVMDLTNPAVPGKKALLATPGDAVGIAVQGNYAYIADYAAGVQVFDVTDPAHPTIVGSYPTNPYWTAGIAVWDHYLVVTANQTLLGFPFHKLLVLDVADPRRPVKVGESALAPDYAVDAVLDGKYAYLAATNSGVLAFDVSSPSNPALAASYNTAGYTLEVDAEDGTVYAADSRGGIVVLELASSPAEPGARVYLPLVVRTALPTPGPSSTVESAPLQNPYRER